MRESTVACHFLGIATGRECIKKENDIGRRGSVQVRVPKLRLDGPAFPKAVSPTAQFHQISPRVEADKNSCNSLLGVVYIWRDPHLMALALVVSTIGLLVEHQSLH